MAPAAAPIRSKDRASWARPTKAWPRSATQVGVRHGVEAGVDGRLSAIDSERIDDRLRSGGSASGSKAPATAADDFATLLAAIQRGDRAAEERLFARFGRAVALLLDRHTNGRPEREDLFQDTFRLLIEKLRRGEVREPEKLPGFIAHLARNLAIEHYRKIARRKTDPAPPEQLDRPTAGDLLGDLLERENAALARRVIADLGTERDRAVLVRFYLSEEDREELGRELGLSPLQFNRVLHRARQRYKELYLARANARDRDRTFDRAGLWWLALLGAAVARALLPCRGIG